MKKGSIRDMASCDFDLHWVNKSIVAARRYSDASHARRDVKLHIPFLCSPTTTNLAAANTKATNSTSFPPSNTPPTIRSTAIFNNFLFTDKISYLGFPVMIFASLSFPCLWSSQRPHWRFKNNDNDKMGFYI